MRILSRSLWLLLMVPGLAYGQIAAHPTDSSTNTSDVGTQLDALREALLRTQQQVAAQQQEIQVLKAQLKGGQSGAGGALVSAVEVVRPNPSGTNANPSDLAPEIHNDVANTSSPSADPQAQHAGQTPSPAAIQ